MYLGFKDYRRLHKGQIGDFLMVGIEGEIYACKPDIFEKTYEVIH